MESTAEILTREIESIRIDLIKRYDELGMRASGDWAESTEKEVTQQGSRFKATVSANDYTNQLVQGRRPGAFPPIAAIEKWINDKGIAAVERDISVSSLAYLIARKIAREGTKYYQQGGTDLIDSVVTPERVQSIIDQVAEINVKLISDRIVSELEKIAVAA